MPYFIEISDFSDHGLEVFEKLTEVQLRNKLEPEKGIFIAESPKVIRRALNAGYEPISLLMEKKHIEGNGKDIIDRCGDIPVYYGDRVLLDSLTGYALTRGILCAMKRPVLPSIEKICENASRIVVLEGIADSTNVGAIFRSAAAMHMDAVLLTPTCCDPLCRRSVRVSMGTVFQIPWTRIGKKPSHWPEEGLFRLTNMGFRTAAMALSDHSVSIEDPLLHKEQKLAIILGTEGDGLSPNTIAKCDYSVKIPMSHGVDSLNVAAAGAVAFWELRKR